MKQVAKALIKNQKGEYLLLIRSDTHPRFPRHFDLPGGEVDPGEEIIEAVCREIQEEVALELKGDLVKQIMKVEYPDVVHYLYEIQLDYTPTNIQIGWEHSSYEWLNKSALVENEYEVDLDPYFEDVLKMLNSLYSPIKIRSISSRVKYEYKEP